MTNEKQVYENATITLPIGLKAEARKRGLNVSGTCADAINRAIIALDQREEYEAWCAANPGNAIHIEKKVNL